MQARVLCTLSRGRCRLLTKSGKHVQSHEAELSPLPGSVVPDLAPLLGQLREIAGRSGSVAVSIVLAPDLCEVRSIVTPPLGRADAARFIAAQTAAVFLRQGDLQLTCAPIRGGRRRRWLVAAAPSYIVEAVRQIVQAAGARVRCIAPVHEYVAAALAQDCRAASEHIFACDDHAQLLQLERGSIVGVLTPLASAAAHPTVFEPGVGAFDVAARLDFARDLVTRPVPLRRVLAVGVMVALLAIGGFQWWRVSRALDMTRTYRERLEQPLELARIERDLLARQAERLERIHSLHAAAAPASLALIQIARDLPATAHLTRMVIRGDTLELEGRAEDARGTYDALLAAGSFGSLRAVRPLVKVQLEHGSADAFLLEGIRR